ncbi:MAG: peptide deformylase 2 [Acidimicrobiia bacterium]|nr:MAG: peptide deformylase 2 [Acidimicrobiia bacterium]
MAVLPIRTFGDPVLRVPAREVDDIDDRVRKLVQDMIDTMYDAPGVGLAAPQVGVSRRIAVFDAQDGDGARVLINPTLEEVGGDDWIYEEGCLSIPGHYWEIVRPAYARVSAIDLDGRPVTYQGEGLLGRVLQHELDHLDGVLLIQRLPARERRRAFATLRREGMGLSE